MCCSDGLDYCPAGETCCGNGLCAPNGGVCCSDGLGACYAGEKCVGSGQCQASLAEGTTVPLRVLLLVVASCLAMILSM